MGEGSFLSCLFFPLFFWGGVLSVVVVFVGGGVRCPPATRCRGQDFEEEHPLVSSWPRSPVVAFYPFLGEGSPTQIDYRRKKSWYPYCNLSTEEPSFHGEGFRRLHRIGPVGTGDLTPCSFRVYMGNLHTTYAHHQCSLPMLTTN